MTVRADVARVRISKDAWGFYVERDLTGGGFWVAENGRRFSSPVAARLTVRERGPVLVYFDAQCATFRGNVGRVGVLEPSFRYLNP